MARYTQTPIILGPNPVTKNKDRQPRFANIKYPLISRDINDIYVLITEGDRFDLLAQQYYNDSSLWWIISTSNYGVRQDSLIPRAGSQVRIPSPSRISQIISNYEALNGF